MIFVIRVISHPNQKERKFLLQILFMVSVRSETEVSAAEDIGLLHMLLNQNRWKIQLKTLKCMYSLKLHNFSN